MTIGAFTGSLMAGPMALKLGRKSCLWIACVLCCASNGIMIGSTSIGGLYAGRLLIGIANGFYMTFAQLYLQEVAPARYRGAAIAAFNTWTSLGALVGTVVDNFTASIAGRDCYIIPLSIIFVVPTLMGIGLFFIPESPRYLMTHNKVEQARKALVWLRPHGSDIEAEMAEIEATAAADRDNAKGTGWLDLFRDPIDRRRTMIAVGAVTTQAASGAFFMIGKSVTQLLEFSANITTAYGTYFFEMAGVGTPFENSCILSAVGVVAIIITIFVMPRWGRRRIFMTTGLIICAFAQLIVAAVYTVHPGTQSTGKAIVGLSIVYIAGYNVSHNQIESKAAVF